MGPAHRMAGVQPRAASFGIAAASSDGSAARPCPGVGLPWRTQRCLREGLSSGVVQHASAWATLRGLARSRRGGRCALVRRDRRRGCAACEDRGGRGGDRGDRPRRCAATTRPARVPRVPRTGCSGAAGCHCPARRACRARTGGAPCARCLVAARATIRSTAAQRVGAGSEGPFRISAPPGSGCPQDGTSVAAAGCSCGGLKCCTGRAGFGLNSKRVTSGRA